MNTGMKIAIIGAGSSYTPEIVERLVELKDELPVRELAFMDIDPARMETVAGFCRRFMKHLCHEIPLHTGTDRRKAIEGDRFVITQIRVGLNAQRILDEKIPLKYGIIGQETTSPGGMFKALRTIPAMLEIAHDVQAVAPEAWIINFTNPTGLVAEAVTSSPITAAASTRSRAPHPTSSPVRPTRFAIWCGRYLGQAPSTARAGLLTA